MRSSIRLAVMVVAALAACGSPTKDDGEESATQPGADNPEGETTPGGTNAAESGPASARMRRLTAREFNASVEDIFGDTAEAASGFPTDATESGFDNDFANLTVSDLLVQQVQTAAESVASRMVAKLSTLLPCSAAKPLDEASCSSAFVDTYGRKVYRRPLDATERSRLLLVYTNARTKTDFPTALRTVAEAMLQSPNFLFRTELGVANATGIVKLSPYEIASELSYLLWASTPDAALLDAAEKGALDDAAGIQAQAARLLADPRAKRSVEAFFVQWLEVQNPFAISKSQTLYPGFDDKVATSLISETRAFVDEVVWKGDATLTTLLTSTSSFANADVAKIYGIANGPSGSTFVPVTLDPTQRAGLITHPSVIAAHNPPGDTSPVRTGKFIRENFFCQKLAPPPPDIPPLKTPDANLSTRDRFADHDAKPACAACHSIMDPIGFGFEQYDAVGKWRTMDGKLPVTGQGNIIGTDVDGDFKGPVELAQKLAASDQVRKCFTSQIYRYSFGRPTTAADGAAIQKVHARFVADKSNVRTLLTAVTESDSFLYRRAAELSAGGGQ